MKNLKALGVNITRKINRTDNILGPLITDRNITTKIQSQHNEDSACLVCDLCNEVYSLYSSKSKETIAIPIDIQVM